MTTKKTPVKRQTTTKKKAPLAPKAKAPISKRDVIAGEVIVDKTPPVEPAMIDREETTKPEPEQPKQEPQKAFSSEEVDELKINLEMPPEGEQEAEEANDNEAPETASDEDQESTEAKPDVLTPEQAEQLAKDMFYMALNGGTMAVNTRMNKDHPLGPVKAFTLQAHGQAGRMASDQVFDRLCDVPLFKKYLLKLSDQKAFMDKWGAVIMLSVNAYGMYQEEKQVRLQAIQIMAEQAKAKQAETEKADNDNDKPMEAAA